MAASASSSLVPRRQYEVFISFRGSDVRSGFLSHLKKELCRKKINVYVDERLERGEEISSALMKAIEGSKIALVIFSKDYAFSKWCLDELVKIMKCKEANEQIVIPIFYQVDPSDVRHQKNMYASAFTLHEHKFKDDTRNLQIWRSALNESADLSGYPLSNFQNESELIDAILEDVLQKLEVNSPIMMPNSRLIGFHQNFSRVESLMKNKPQEVIIIGIWGLRGIGKTTLARAIFDRFLSQFENHYFLANVREELSKSDDLSSLRQKLLCKLLKENDHINMNDAVRRLQGEKVLIVLDDVDNRKQLNYLAGLQCLHWGQGSRIIVTSRDKHVLEGGRIHGQCYIHEVNELNSKDSLKLFCVHAFDQSHPKMGYQELSEETVAFVKGIPLALEVLGSHFYCRDKAYWESELKKLKKYPHKEIENILKISYNGLNPMDKTIFLFIAFFFVGEHKDMITCVLKACGFEAFSGIQNLIDKALIKSNQLGRIEMHDLIREMAEQINHENPERRSLLKDADVCDILESNNKEIDKIEGIILNPSQGEYPQFGADFLVKLKKLKILKFVAFVELQFGLNFLPNQLRYLRWDHYPLEYLPSGSCFEYLVELHLKNSKARKLWDGKQNLKNLKRIDLRRSKQLEEVPDLSMAQRLEIVDLSDCINLRSVHPSILSLHSLVTLDVSGCTKLESLEGETHLESLSDLQLWGCFSLKRFSLSSKKLIEIDLIEMTVEKFHLPSGHCSNLRMLALDGEGLRSLPVDEMCYLTNLEVFEVTNFKQVIDTIKLHSLFDALRNLATLCLAGWSCLSEIPDSIKGLLMLESLRLDDTAVETLPACINHLSSLTHISLRRCKRLKSILGLPPYLEQLDATECTSLETVSFSSLCWNKCDIYMINCVKLDEHSLRSIQEVTRSLIFFLPVTRSLMTSCYVANVCYPGSRVPKWMGYKQMTKASNTIQFNYNLEHSLPIVFCCIAPHHLVSEGLKGVFCDVYYDNNESTSEFLNPLDLYEDLYEDDDVGFDGLNSDHVFLWCMEMDSYGAKITCEFFIEITGKEGEASKVPVEACGVHIMYPSGWKRKSDDVICHPLQDKFIRNKRPKDLSRRLRPLYFERQVIPNTPIKGERKTAWGEAAEVDLISFFFECVQTSGRSHYHSQKISATRGGGGAVLSFVLWLSLERKQEEAEALKKSG